MGISLESKSIVRQMMEAQRFAVLATIHNEQPYSNLVAFAASNDLKTILFATNSNTQKYRNILINRNVALLIDNRDDRHLGPGEALAITALGTATEKTLDMSDTVVQSYLTRHPSLEEFLRRADTAVFFIEVTDYILARFDGAERIRVDGTL